MPIGNIVEIKAPLGLPPVLIPADNPPTAETIALGRRLFYDPILSSDRSVSCASCHSPQFGFADSRPLSEGVGKKTGTATLRPSSMPPTLTSSSGMGVPQHWKPRRKAPCKIRWKWPTR